MLMSFLLACWTTLLGLGGSIFFAKIVSPFHAGWSLTALTAADLQPLLWAPLVVIIVICTVAPWVASIVTLKKQGLPVAPNLPSLLVLFLLGWGISLANTVEAGKALLTRREWEFTRTPKYAGLKDRGAWRSKIYQVPLDLGWAAEGLLVVLGLVAILHAVSDSATLSLLLLIPYTSAYAFVLALTALQSRRGQLS
jgi:hypothetical protein